MEKIAIYGKGGVGKSVVATALSACYAGQGRKVLHIGCDPKHDSALRLLDRAVAIPTVLEVLAENPNLTSTESILHLGRNNIVCCEAGGPEPGLGCGGRGVARTLEFLEEMEVIAKGNYDVVIFDVLGDVVCGGFAAPLREGFAEKVIIVVSEEPMALYAANNIAKAINTYKRNGVVLAGFVASLKSADAPRGLLERFAAALSTRILACVPRDPQVLAAERQQRTVVEHAPDSPAARELRAVAERVLAIKKDELPAPTPLADEAFFALMRE